MKSKVVLLPNGEGMETIPLMFEKGEGGQSSKMKMKNVINHQHFIPQHPNDIRLLNEFVDEMPRSYDQGWFNLGTGFKSM